MTELYDIRASGLTDVGLVRKANEDSILLMTEQSFWLVADGMGGHANGALASQTAVSGFKALQLSDDFEQAITEIADRMHAVNSRLSHMNSEAESGQMGTTAISLLIRGDKFAVIWVGDSRAYIYRRGGLFQISVDHTHVQDLVDEGILRPEEAKDHPMGHVLTRALGVQESVQVDVVQDIIEPGDRIILCSDGLTGPVSDDRIREIVTNNCTDTAVADLIGAAHAGGAADNVTVIVVAIDGESS